MQCSACATAGVKTVLGRIDHDDGRTWGAPSPETAEHGEVGQKWFLAHCDNAKCIRGREHANKANWHENGFCLECAWNPYNHIATKEATND